MAHQFEIPFSNGSLSAAYPDGPPLAGGRILGDDNRPLRAYRFLLSLKGVDRGFVVQRTRLLGSAAEISFRGCTLRIVNSMILNQRRSRFPANGPQVQVYDGPLLLSWEAQNLVSPVGFRRLMAWHGQPGHAEIAGTITLTYPPDADADIAGTGVGTFARPGGFPGANRPVTGTFGSAVPARPNEFISVFRVRNFVLRGTWAPRFQIRLAPGARIPRIPRPR